MLSTCHDALVINAIFTGTRFGIMSVWRLQWIFEHIKSENAKSESNVF